MNLKIGEIVVKEIIGDNKLDSSSSAKTTHVDVEVLIINVYYCS